MTIELLSMRDVLALTKISRVHLWRLRKAGKFPAPVQYSGYAPVWKPAAVARWLKARAK
jgi:predicted DNA-binding transcriptional regulator AlpA